MTGASSTAVIACALALQGWMPQPTESRLIAADWPCLGRDATRNPVSPEQDPPTDWDVATGRNIKWTAEIASAAFGAPVVADGLVWVGGNRWRPGKPDPQDAALLLCFDEQTGEKLYEFVSPRLGAESGYVHEVCSDPHWHGLGSSPLVEGNRLWFVTNRAETICLDIAPLQQTPRGEPQVVWRVDLLKTFGVHPHQPLMGPSRLCSIAPSYRGLIFVCTGNGVDDSHVKILHPDAPGLICFDKDTGEAKWQVRTGVNVLFGELASPLVADIGGRGQVVMPHGDGWLRSYDPTTGRLLWECDGNLKESLYSMRGKSERNYFLSTPVLYEDRIYIAHGQQPEMADGSGRLLCVDPTKSGDISAELAVDRDGALLPRRRLRNVDPSAGERAIPNPNTGIVWSFSQPDPNQTHVDEWVEAMHRTVGSVAIQHGTLVVADLSGVVHCLDARTGEPSWHHDERSPIWASPLVVNELAYVTNEVGEVCIYKLVEDVQGAPQQHGTIDHEPLATIEMPTTIATAPVFANGVLYVTTRSTLYAIQQPAAAP